jgi:DNA-binding CsgD family transcriptional regulator
VTISPLTRAEEEILFGLADGMTLKEIAKERFRSYDTVKTQMKRLLMKLNAKTPAHAVALAYHHGIFTPQTGLVEPSDKT